MDLSLQLYSMRNMPDLQAILPDVAKMGITQVEGFGGVYADPTGYRAAMDAAGLTMPSGHFGVSDLETDFANAVNTARSLGITDVFAPYLDASERPTDAAGYAAFAKRLGALVAPLANEGMTMGWHNHDFEFVALPDGSIPMQIILDTAPDLTWEADLAWVAVGGSDPLTWVKNYANRLRAVHVKDIAPTGEKQDEDGWANLGEGTMDWASLLDACKQANPDLIYVLEHDNPKDPMAYARASAAAFAKLEE